MVCRNILKFQTWQGGEQKLGGSGSVGVKWKSFHYCPIFLKYSLQERTYLFCHGYSTVFVRGLPLK